MRNVIGIRREDISQWERRVPLIPSHARELVDKHNLDVRVQSSDIRVFTDDDYRAAALPVVDGLSPCRVVFAIKEIPVERLEPDKVYVFFSHTAKGQSYNMPMLRKMMDLGCTLVDYEKMVDDEGRRVLFFGNYAGHAGMADTLWALGRHLATNGIDNPFTIIRQTHHYSGLVALKEAVAELSTMISERGLPRHLTPFVFSFFGYGHVSQGAQEVFDILPFDDVKPRDIPLLFESRADASHLIFKSVFKEEDMVEPVESGKSFDLQDYYQNPENYRPVVEALVPYMTAIINGIYWTPRYPRFLTKGFLKTLFEGPSHPRLRVIGDITCDVNGSLESTVKATAIEDPVYVYDPHQDRALPGFEGRGPVVLAVYNLPAELPMESSTYFSGGLKNLVPELAKADFTSSFSDCGLPEVVKRAVILYRGELTADYAYLRKFVR